jgi:cell division protein ZapA
VAQVNVTINGRTYRMACDDGQEDHLLGLGDRLNAAIADLRATFGEIGDQRLTVMAAITLADQLSESQRQIARLEAELRTLQDEDGAETRRQEAAEAAIARAAAKLGADLPRN